MSGLQRCAQDATSRILQKIPGSGCLDTGLHCAACRNRPLAPGLITSKAGALAQGAHGKDSGYSRPVVAPVPSRRSLRPIDKRGGDSRESFIQSEAPVR